MTKNPQDPVYIKNPDVVFRKIADEFVLVPIRQKAVDLKSIYTLNEAAALIWGLIDGSRAAFDIRGKLMEEFDVEASQAGSDVAEILSQFEALSFIKRA
jgi:hypothetical protein